MSKHVVLVEFKQDGRVHSKIFEPWPTAVPSKGDFMLLNVGENGSPIKLTLQVSRVSWTILSDDGHQLRPRVDEVVTRLTCKVVS